MLTPENVLVILASSEYKGNDAATIEPWVKFPYEVESFKYTASTSDAQDMQKLRRNLDFRVKTGSFRKICVCIITKLFPVKETYIKQPPPPTRDVRSHSKIIYNECGTSVFGLSSDAEFKTQPKASMYFNANLLVESVHDTMCLKMFANARIP